MEDVFSTNLKSAITFLHLAGLALGVGGTWILDVFIMRHMKESVITREKYQIIDFVSRLVMTGLIVLWISGLLFIVYYYFYSPDLLSNQKVWAKTFIVTVLTINGYFVHQVILPEIQQSIGGFLLRTIGRKGSYKLAAFGTISFISWLFPIILGVTKTLNFTVPGVFIVGIYMMVTAFSLLVTYLITTMILAAGSSRIPAAIPVKSARNHK